MAQIDCNEREEYLVILRERYPNVDWDSGEWILEDVAHWQDYEGYNTSYLISKVSDNGPTEYFHLEEGYYPEAPGSDIFCMSWDDREVIDLDTWATVKHNMEG